VINFVSTTNYANANEIYRIVTTYLRNTCTLEFILWRNASAGNWIVFIWKALIGYINTIWQNVTTTHAHSSVSSKQMCLKQQPESRFEIFTAVKIQVKVFRVVRLCSVIVGYQHFGGTYCLHCQGKVHGARKWT
jgi:hypothetical protein